MLIYDVITVGAGPCGLACGIEAQAKGLQCLIIDKGSITESIRRYPVNMTFFSTAENIEIGNVPFISQGIRPNRSEALKYYRKVAAFYQLKLKLFTTVTGIQKENDVFVIDTNTGETFFARSIILATGYYDVPRFLNIPGEELPHVSHYYDEAFKYTQTKTLVVGGANSAIEAALDLYRNGAQVTLIHMMEGLDKNGKYWIVPDLENRIKNNEIKAYFNSVLTSIDEKNVKVRRHDTDEIFTLEADFVFLMTGYRPDAIFLKQIGIKLEGENLIPGINKETFESNIKGIYLAGSIVGGEETAKIFIENGKLHAFPIIDDIVSKLNQRRPSL
ncbi:MAG: YpdA family putative bacillithiol disulfide reductase [Cyclobacteriaceae bacterium]|nr:YpdA family putative bacillithiol disulfide reductase [Cyclobacteriaceae bacterium]